MERDASSLLVPLAGLAVAALAVACVSPFAVIDPQERGDDPTVVIHTSAGDELGVSTDYGVVFLGRGAQSGTIEFTTWFGDGPSREQGIVETIGAGLFVTDAEIEIPTVPVAFQEPRKGTKVLVRGRETGQVWQTDAWVAADPDVSGLLLEPSGRLEDLSPEEVGAGVFWLDEEERPQLLGLISGVLHLADGNGSREYVTVVGPRDLWRLVVQRRNTDRPRRWVYREDLR
jgi:hypothetical protein